MRKDAINPATLDVPGNVATRAQWYAAGATKDMFRDGRLLPAGDNIFALPDVLTSPQYVAELVGALAPAGAVVTGWAAALLHGVRDASPTMQKRSGIPVPLCLARADNRAPRGFVTLRVDLADDDVELVDGVLVTTAARTAYDMVRFSRSLPEAVAVLDAFRCELNPAPVTLEMLDELRQPRPRGRGHPLLRAAMDWSTTRSRSLPESRLRVRTGTVLDLAPDDLAVNIMLKVDNGGATELDLLDRTSGMGLEYDSKFHSDTEQRERDARKDLEIRDAGLDVVRVNSITAARSNVELGRILRRAQARARRAGGAEVVRRLAAEGRLVEEPLKNFSSAVD